MISLSFAAQSFAEELIRITPEQQSSLGIELGTPEKISTISSLNLPGEITLPVGKEVVVSAPQPGVVDQIFVAGGQHVQKGQVLANLNSQELVALQRDFLQAQTRLRLAKKNLERDAELFKEGVIAERRFQTTQTEYEEVNAAVVQSRQSLRIAGLGEPAVNRLQNSGNIAAGSSLVAPISGQVIEHNINAGQRVDPSTPLFKIADLSTLWAVVHVPVDAVAKVHIGSAAIIGKTEIPGKVISIIRNVNRNDQTVQVRVEFKDPANLLAKNQYVEVKLTLDTSSGTAHSADKFNIPRTAIARHDGKTYVFSRANAQQFSPKRVEVLAETGGKITIAPLAPLDKQIAISGIATLKAAWLDSGKGHL